MSEEQKDSKLATLWRAVIARRTQLLVVVIVVLVVVVAVLASDRNNDEARALITPVTEPNRSVSVEAAAPPTTTPLATPTGVPWQDALAHVGESVTILGPVAGTNFAESSNGSPTFLNLGVDYPDSDRFTVVIWGEDRGRFPSPPEDMYMGRNVAVTGVVENYKGVAQIMVSTPAQIRVY